MSVEYDLVVLGGGPGGYVAAIRASQLGMNVALVEKENVGGTCLHEGCIPSKTFLKSAETFRHVRNSNDFGIELNDQDISFNFATIQKRKEEIVSQLHSGVEHLLKRANVDIYNGFGRIMGPSIFSPISGTISVEHSDGRENTLLSPKFVLISTGSKPRSIDGLDVDGQYILDSSHVLNLNDLPSSVIIVGAGVIGIEFASILNDFNVDVTVVEATEHILTNEDKDIRHEAKRLLKQRGITFMTNTQLDTHSLSITDQVSINVIQNEAVETLQADKLIVATGRQANITNIGIENTKIDIDNHVIKTNDMYQTAENHIYAIGDCIGGMELAHVASKEGIIAVEHMANESPYPLNQFNIPSCVYSYPEISRVGLTEQEAIKNNYKIKVGKFSFSHNSKAMINREQDGFIKIISNEENDDILGIHMIGSHVTELISEGSLAKMLDATPWEISQTVHPHPSISESVMEAALSVKGEQIHG